MSLRALLIDLDDTLLLFDHQKFIRTYFQLASKHFPEIDTPQFLRVLQEAEQSIYEKKNPEGTTIDAFLASFCPGVSMSPGEVLERFDLFYQEDFNKLKDLIQFRRADGAIEVLKKAKECGLRLVLATNPVFPLVAIEKRLAFGGFSSETFDLVTTGENSRFAKPNPSYHLAITEEIGVLPYECLMVGNDLTKDILPSREVGMRTYYCRDEQPDVDRVESIADFSGSLEQLSDLLSSL